MTVSVLKSKSENNQARVEMKRRGIDCMNTWLRRILKRLVFDKSINVGDFSKSWDVLKSLQFIEKHLSLTDPILDLGAYASEILCSLQRLNYTKLTGIDLDSRLPQMPNAKIIQYIIGDFFHTPFEDGSFAAITSISVIEHGFQCYDLLSEVARIITSGGYFIASLDYWPDKIQTDTIKAFGMNWNIFSRTDLINFIEEAKKFSLYPVDDMDFSADEKTIEWNDRQYTTAWLVLQKVNKV